MPRPDVDAVRELEELAAAGGQVGDTNFERYLECQQLQDASAVLGSALSAFSEPHRLHGAFTARTHTPLLAPPGWLPPPI